MDDAEAFELIDAHLDRETLTDEQSDALTAWITADPQRADHAFYRIFLHSYLRTRLQSGILPGTSELSVLKNLSPGDAVETEIALLVESELAPIPKFSFWRNNRLLVFIACGLITGAMGWAGWFVLDESLNRSGNKIWLYSRICGEY